VAEFEYQGSYILVDYNEVEKTVRYGCKRKEELFVVGLTDVTNKLLNIRPTIKKIPRKTRPGNPLKAKPRNSKPTNSLNYSSSIVNLTTSQASADISPVKNCEILASNSDEESVWN
jgi:hypothetical protein